MGQSRIKLTGNIGLPRIKLTGNRGLPRIKLTGTRGLPRIKLREHGCDGGGGDGDGGGGGVLKEQRANVIHRWVSSLCWRQNGVKTLNFIRTPLIDGQR